MCISIQALSILLLSLTLQCKVHLPIRKKTRTQKVPTNNACSSRSFPPLPSGNSIACNGWSNNFMPAKKHFPDATLSKVPIGTIGSPVCKFCTPFSLSRSL
jgi:hypothetical protein